jgi:hypothetical protein
MAEYGSGRHVGLRVRGVSPHRSRRLVGRRADARMRGITCLVGGGVMDVGLTGEIADELRRRESRAFEEGRGGLQHIDG